MKVTREKMKSLLPLLGFLLSFLTLQNAEAFPEMARHGYVNCQTCHVSPNGGGILNDYGRELSKEVLAVWKSDSEKNKEHLSAYGILAETPIQKWLKLGGDSRSLYLYQNDQFAKQAKTQLMQAQLEAAVDVGQGHGHFTLVGTLDFESDKDPFSRRHYLLYGITENLQFRVGKFIPAYGINTADHVTLTRSAIRMGPMFEAYNAELSYHPTEQTEFFLTGLLGKTEKTGTPSETGFAAQAAYAFADSYKVGVSVLRGSDSTRDRWLYGPYGILGITSWMSFMTEIDVQSIKTPTASRTGLMSTQKLSFEPTPGLWTYLVQEYGKSNFDNPLTESDVYGLGIQFFPRTHFEFNLAWEKVRNLSFSTEFYDYFWLVGHFYL